jgi:hypothetical protein
VLNLGFPIAFIASFLCAVGVFFRDRGEGALEVLALRQQLTVLKRKRSRPVLSRLDRFFRTTLRSVWSCWTDVLVIVKPEPVIGWHRAGYRLYWHCRSRTRRGRPKITDEIRVLIRPMAQENAGWGAPKIHGELRKLGFDWKVTVGTAANRMMHRCHINDQRNPNSTPTGRATTTPSNSA